MNPMPCFSMHSRNRSGGKSIRTPRASSTSAPPLFEVIPRFPCFTTPTPAPATTNMLVVETLKRSSLSPPVPHTSRSGFPTASSLTSGSTARSRNASTKPRHFLGCFPFFRQRLEKFGTPFYARIRIDQRFRRSSHLTAIEGVSGTEISGEFGEKRICAV